MTTPQNPADITRALRRGIVLTTTEAECTLVVAGRRVVVPYARPFPTPRVDRVSPGHLVATATSDDGSEVVVWRWFDAVVQDVADRTVGLWEPAHGSVIAEPRDPKYDYRPGSRAYLSAGLPGAEWWVAGPVVDRAENADVELDEVAKFFTSLGLWDDLS